LINREGYYVGKFDRECTKCGIVFKKTSKTVTLCPSCNSERVKSSKTTERKLWERARNRAKLSGLEFTITLEDIELPPTCKYLNIPLNVHSGSSGGKFDSPSLDRIDNSKGYIKDNIQVISHLANVMKASATKEQLKMFCNSMLKDLGQD
jgi:predicted  nucleic acid-binding Zn-ribbon protein